MLSGYNILIFLLFISMLSGMLSEYVGEADSIQYQVIRELLFVGVH